MKRFRDILCWVDSSRPGSAALQRAVELARNHQARLKVVDVIDQRSAEAYAVAAQYGVDVRAELRALHEQRLRELVAPFQSDMTIETSLLRGPPFLAVIQDVLGNDRDLIVKEAQRADWVENLFGSDDMHLLRKCPCPVWMVKPPVGPPGRRIVAAVDVSGGFPAPELKVRDALNDDIVRLAAGIAVADGCELDLVHVWQAVGEESMRAGRGALPAARVQEYVEQVRAEHAGRLDTLVARMDEVVGADANSYVKPRTHLLKGAPQDEICAYVGRVRADLVVMGTVARTGLPGFFMGNTAEAILGRLNCSVLAIKPVGFQTPVKLPS